VDVKIEMHNIPCPGSTPMSCSVCTVFLEDFLRAGISKDLEIHKKIRLNSLIRATPDLVHWIHRIYQRLSWNDFEKCQTLATRISRRGRKQSDYDYLLNTATWNLLKYEVPWLEQEINHMKLLLVEAGVCKGRHVFVVMSVAQELLSYIAPRALQCLHCVHDDHVNPKGLMTDVGSLGVKRRRQEETLFDNDDYQREILDEITDDLYT
jgi:hypothetical protein